MKTRELTAEDHAWLDGDRERMEAFIDAYFHPRCDNCDTPGEFYDGLCYQCQCELHALGLYDMDGP